VLVRSMANLCRFGVILVEVASLVPAVRAGKAEEAVRDDDRTSRAKGECWSTHFKLDDHERKSTVARAPRTTSTKGQAFSVLLSPLYTVHLPVPVGGGPDSHLQGTRLVVEFDSILSGEGTFDLFVNCDDGNGI